MVPPVGLSESGPQAHDCVDILSYMAQTSCTSTVEWWHQMQVHFFPTHVYGMDFYLSFNGHGLEQVALVQHEDLRHKSRHTVLASYRN